MAQRASPSRLSGPPQPQWWPSVLGSYLAPPSWVVSQTWPACSVIFSNSSALVGQASSSRPSRAWHTVVQLEPPPPFTQVAAAAGPAAARSAAISAPADPDGRGPRRDGEARRRSRGRGDK